jgi:hypothetical protein
VIRGLVVTTAVVALLAAPAAAGPGLLVGVSEDSMKWSDTAPTLTRAHLRRLGIGAIRVTLRWSPGQSRPRGKTMIALRRALQASAGRRLVLAVYSRADRAPQIARLRSRYCGYVAVLLAHAPQVSDVVIWNEPNSSTFWRPQFDADGRSAAAPAYERLLAECWDDLHAVRPDVNVIAASAPRGNNDPAAARPSHSPVRFYRELGRAYRESGRDRPIFDTVGHNPYPKTSAEPPWATHDDGTIGEGDYETLVSVLTEAFAGTAQPVPGADLSIWYMEDGFQTRVDPAFSRDYVGTETDAWALDPDDARSARDRLHPRGLRTIDQASQLADAVRLAYCQPYVGAFFNFLLVDEERLTGWQSGLLWSNWQPKPSYWVFQQAVANVRSGWVDCAAYGGR